MYFDVDFSTLRARGVATPAQCAGVARPIEHVAGAVRELFRARGATRGVPPVFAGAAERQSAQVDERDARARQRAGQYQAFQHFITMRPGARTASGGSCARRCPSARGVLILDGTSFPKQGPQSVARGAAVLRHARQDRQLPSGRDGGALDRRARVDAGRGLVSARRVADARGAAAGRIPTTVRFQEKWRLALTLLRQVRGRRLRRHGGARRCGVRRQLDAASHAASAPPAVCARRLVDADRVPRDAGRRPARAVVRARPAAHASSAAGAHAPRRSARSRRRIAPRAWRLVTWRNGTNRPWARPLLRAPRDAGARVARSAASRRKSGCCASATRARRRAPSPTSSTCRRPRRCARSCAWRISAGRSSSSIKSSRTNSGSITSRAARCPAGTPRRADRARVHLAARRTATRAAPGCRRCRSRAR